MTIKNIKNIIPKKYTYVLVNLKKSILGGFSRKSFSENGEDLVINRYFAGKRNGFYVDVGAFHPKLISNTQLLYSKNNWSGINIDANPETITSFNRARKGDTNINAGVSLAKGTLEYYSFQNAGINTFDKEVAERKSKSKHHELLGVTKINCLPLSEILKDSVPAGTHIDLLDIDVEGLDLEVLQSNNWSTCRPEMIVVEDTEFKEKPANSEIYNYLLQKDYVFYSYVGIALIMVDGSKNN